MCHHVHGAYAQHSAVHIITMEHGIHIVIFVLLVEKDLLLAIVFEIIADRNKESRSTARRIAYDVIHLGIHHIYHHSNDMPRCSELSVHSGSSYF